ncbi:helix-turn-helix transcriptional regulator [Clostridium sp.]|uniref:helix-turn-helix domain-containing protein n=1 Tax=Clostridium sp. TaxID=1506 RepID=UPI002610DBDE|nr:helix-turn-helix transcriptional regulator [Clostridium sp.]
MLGNRIKSLREERNLKQIDLASYLNIGRSTLSQYESNKRVPSDEIKNKLADYFNVSLDYLMGKSDIKESVDQLLKYKSTTIALHNSNGIDDELPDEAKKEIEDFIEYVKHKYKK